MPILGPAKTIKKTGIAQSKAQIAAKAPNPSQVFIQSKYGPVGYNVFGPRPTNPSFIKQFQQEARRLGIYKGAIDGVWGPQSARAWAIYNTRPKKGQFGFASTLGAQASYGLYVKQQAAAIQKQYAQLQTTVNRLRGQGQLNQLDQAIMLSQFWAQQLGKAGGAFDKVARQSQKELAQLNAIQAQYTAALNEQSRQEKRALNPPLPQKALGFLTGKVLAPAARFTRLQQILFSPFKRDILEPAGRTVIGKKVVEAVGLPMELVKRATYAEQLLRRQRGEGTGFRINPLQSGNEEDELISVALGAFGLKRFQSRRVQAALSAVSGEGRRQALTRAGKLSSFGEYIAGKSGAASTALDFLFNFADPTLAVGKAYKTITEINSARVAAIVLSRTPAAVEGLTKTIADLAAKAAERGPVGLDIGDVRLLQKQVPSLRGGRKLTANLASALVSKSPEQALDVLALLEESSAKAAKGAVKASDREAGKQLLANVQEAISKVKDEGMTTASRQAILKASLGVVWKPKIPISQLIAGRGAQLSLPFTANALRAMPYVTRQAKLATLTRLLSRGAGKDVSYIGAILKDPAGRGFIRLAGRTAAEKAAADKILKTMGKEPVARQTASLERRLKKLPDSAITELLATRLAGFKAELTDYLDNQLKSLSPEELRLLKLGDEGFSELLKKQKALVKQRVKLLDEAGAKGTSLMEKALETAQDRLAAMRKVEEVRKGSLRQKVLAKEFQSLRKDIVGLQKVHPIAFDEAVKNFNSELRDYNYMIGAPVVGRLSPWTGIYRAAMRTFNDTPKSMINVHDVDERAKTLRDWAIALGQSRPDADSIYARMARIMKEEDALQEAKDIQNGVIHNYLVQQGLPTKAIKETLGQIRDNGQQFLRENQGWYSVLDARARKFKAKFDKVFGVSGEKDPQVLSQDQYHHYLVSPDDLRRYTLEWKRKNGSIASATAAAIDIVGEKLIEYYAPVHYIWKFSVLTLAAPRYVLRVAGMDERLRMWMTHGFASFTQISSKIARRLNNKSLERTAGARFMSGLAEVGLEGFPMHLMDHALIEIVGHGLINKGEKGFVENLWHILHFQVRPEDDFVQEILMGQLWKGNKAGMEAARESVIETLETTKHGRDYLAKAVMMDPKLNDSKLLVERTENWLRDVMPNQAIVDKRLGGQFTLQELEKHEEWWPEKTWGDKYESLLKLTGPGDTYRKWKTLWGRLVIQSPTTALNRQPFAFAEFAKEFDSLTASGLDARTASEWATEYAVHRTNEILFDASVRSRFSHKLDIIFPFQQAREEMVRVWFKLLKEHPARFATLLHGLATTFNNGVNNGTFTKNQYGEWVMKVPGSPELSRALGRWLPTWVPFREGLVQTAGTQYSFALQNLLFVNDTWGTIPRPGGPFWVSTANVAVHLNPDLFPRTKFWQKYLFDERNPSLLIWRPEVSRLWMAATGQKIIPWEPFSWGHVGYDEPVGERMYDKLAGEVGAELIKQWIDAGANPKDKPTAEDVANATRAALFMHGLMGMFVPAATTPTVPGREEFNSIVKQYTVDGQLDTRSLLAGHPDMLGFAAIAHYKDAVRAAYTNDDGTVDIARLKAQNPGYWERWKQRGSPREDSPESLVDSIYRVKDYLSPEEFIQAVDRSRRISQAWQDYNRILNSGVPGFQKVTEIAQLEKDNSDLGEWQDKRMRDYRRSLEFDMIMKQPAIVRDEMLKEWQFKYDVSFSQMAKLQAGWSPNQSHYNPWLEARNTIDIANEYQRNQSAGNAVTWAEKNLTVAERYNFYTYMMGVALNAQDFNEMYGARGKLVADHAKDLFHKRLTDTVDESTAFWSETKHDAAMTIQKKYDHINAISKLMKDIAPRAKAAHGKQAHILWEQYFALKDKQQRVYAEIRGIQNSLYKTFPDLRSAADEVRMMQFIGRDGPAAFKKNGLDAYGIPHLTDSQEKKWNEMPERIKQDYVQDLTERLTLPAFYSLTKRGESRLHWDWLTEFQKDMLRNRLDKKQLDMVKRMSADAATAESNGFFRGGHGFHRFRRFRWQVWGHTLGNGFGELAFALEMFRQYNRRGNMQPPQAELDEYRRLRDNPILKAQFLKTHPRLQAWLRAGPMANMPPVVADIVQNIMVKYGRWQSDQEPLSWDDLAELGFAHTILKKYDKREGPAPKAYELWVKMPTGKARFDYMKQHPEIQAWLQDGPMAQMPNEYREIVRDIMTKFGEWTQKTDPLSVLLEQYYATPDHAKQQFLEEHPEIIAYWRAIRSGRERQLFDLAQGYFALPDPDSKKAYILAHPEVQDYFIQERQRRYESFLQDVARYLGHVPELAEHYLRDQTAFIRETLDKFAYRPLVPPEVTHVTYSSRREG